MSDPWPGADAALDAAIAARVEDAGRSEVSLDGLWRVFAEVDPDLYAAGDRRARLRASLDRLVADGVLQMPSARNKSAWDRAGAPELPARVRSATTPAVPAPRRSSKPPATLRPELVLPAGLALRPDEVDVLEKASAFLRDWDDGRPLLPARERSLEVFGDEKRIDALASARLFRLGVLGYELLRCFPTHPPFAHERVGRSGVVLVLENHDTYHSAARALREDARGIDVAVYGAGKALWASASYFSDLDPPVGEIRYFGDLDAAGLWIPIRAHHLVQEANLPAITPAVPLYEQLFRLDRRCSTPRPRPAAGDETLVSWLPPELRTEAAALLEAGLRLPQEAVSYEVLSGLARWT